MPTQKGAVSAASRPSSARTTVMSKAMSFNSTGGGGISRQSSRDSIGGLESSRRKSVGGSMAGKSSGASTRRQSSACGLARPASGGNASAKDRVTVAVRKRPASGTEVDVVTCSDLSAIQVAEPKKRVDLKEYTEKHQFNFDYAFDEACDNEYVYQCTAKPLVPFVMSGGLATCFAFGQTGSGKTHTMLGSPSHNVPGLYVLASQDIFRSLDKQSDDYDVFVSMMEIYGDDVYDLLSPNKQRLIPREDAKKKVQIQGLVQRPVDNVEELMYAIDSGSTLRSTSTTGMNEASSRSHAILQVSIKTLSGKLHGQLSFIDLAGSEKGSDTAENVKKTRLEGAEINKSLLALKECIRAMNDPSANYTPFRSSKLTQVLKESFIGNGRTVMIANISPSSYSCLETVNTLRYADRVKCIGKAPAGSRVAAPRGLNTSNLNTSIQEESSFDDSRSSTQKRPMTSSAASGKENKSSTSSRRAAAGGGGASTRRQSNMMALDTSNFVLDDSVDDVEEDMRTRCEVSSQSHKRRRSPTGAFGSNSMAVASSECSFTDDHHDDDDGFVYHGEHTSAEPEHNQQSVEASKERLDPVLFVNSFRHQIERSMQLIEQEVALLDTLERGGSNPLTPGNVQAVQSLLMERIAIASKLQSELAQHSGSARR